MGVLAACWFAGCVFLSAFLLFQVQPLVSKTMLPWFGGSPAVWTTAMMFFQAMLCLGYGYAHALARIQQARVQVLVHGLLLIGAAWAAQGVQLHAPDVALSQAQPAWSVLSLLWLGVGLPYFCLSATGPLLQHWFARCGAQQSVYRLFALSNLGSFLALLSFPFVFEPWLTLPEMAQWWWGLFVVFALLQLGLLGVWVLPKAKPLPNKPGKGSTRLEAVWVWWALPAVASLALVAVSDRVAHAVAPEPRLWVATLAVYLATFVLAFDHPRWYKPKAMAALLLLCTLAVVGWSTASKQFAWGGILTQDKLRVVHLLWLFALCMLCHGEVARRRPANPAHLTRFYAWLSVGGAAGGVFVTLVATPWFNDYYEWPLVVAMGLCLAWWVLGARQRQFLPAVGVLLSLAVWGFLDPQWGFARVLKQQAPVLDQSRNFYGVVSVRDFNPAQSTPSQNSSTPAQRRFYSGLTVHGTQFLHPTLQSVPTTYYGKGSGIELTIAALQAQKHQLRMAFVGLGVGSVAQYARSTDVVHFFEINPEVERIAQRWFYNLRTSKAAEVRTFLGDARLTFEHQTSQNTEQDAYDLILVDAFNGSSVPIHLLTREAFATYARHLKPDGALVVHITNTHLNLYPVVKAQAVALNMPHRHWYQEAGPGVVAQPGLFSNRYMVLSHNPGVLNLQANTYRKVKLRSGQEADEQLERPQVPLWTDHHSSLAPLFW